MASSFSGAGGSGRFGRLGRRGWMEIYGENVMCGRHVGASDGDDSVEVLERLELCFHLAVALAKLFQEHLAQIFRDRSRLAAGGYAFNGNVDAFVLIQDNSFKIG